MDGLIDASAVKVDIEFKMIIMKYFTRKLKSGRELPKNFENVSTFDWLNRKLMLLSITHFKQIMFYKSGIQGKDGSFHQILVFMLIIGI